MSRTFHLVFGAQGEDAYDFRRANLLQPVADELRGRSFAFVLERLIDVRFRRYQPGYKPEDDEVLYLDLEREPTLTQTIEATRQLAQLDNLEDDPEFVERLKVLLAVFQARGGAQVTLISAYSPSQELTRTKKLALILEHGTFDRLRQPTFLVDGRFDCAIGGGYLFIWSVHEFQRIFGYFERLRARTRQTLNAIRGRDLIRNFDEFEAACLGQLQMMAKLASIADKDYLAALTMERLRRTIDDYRLEVRIDAGRLVFEPGRDQRWLILKLLDDDYLRSTMTDQRYEVNSKVTIR